MTRTCSVLVLLAGVLPVLWGAALHADSDQGMARFKSLFPDGLVNAAGEPLALENLKGKVVGVYFSAKWCGPCRRFTPMLVDYRNRNQDDFEIVFVSSDRSAEQQADYMRTYNMQWAAVPFASKTRQNLQVEFRAQSIPTLVLLNSKGEILTHNGRELVQENVDGKRLKNAKVVKETYLCGRCTNEHVRERLVLDD